MRLEDVVNHLKTNCFMCNHLTQGWTGNIWPITPRVHSDGGRIGTWYCYIDLTTFGLMRPVRKHTDIYVCIDHWYNLHNDWILNAKIEVDEYRAWTNWIEAIEEGKDLRRSRSDDGS